MHLFALYQLNNHFDQKDEAMDTVTHRNGVFLLFGGAYYLSLLRQCLCGFRHGHIRSLLSHLFSVHGLLVDDIRLTLHSHLLQSIIHIII